MDRRAFGIAAGVLALLVLAWAIDAALGLGTFAVHDLRHHHLPWRVWAASEWLDGRVPLWAPGVANGFPMLAEGQGGVLYPPTMFLFMFLPPAIALNWTLLLHIWWAALGTWVFLRASGRSPTAAIFGAVAFAFSGFMASHALYLGMQNGVAWLPWLLAGIRRASWPGVVLCATMMLVAGHPQAAVIGLMLGAVYGLRQAWNEGQGKGWRRRLPWACALALGLAACLASPQILASMELAEFGMRGGGVDAAFAHIGSLPPQEIVGAVLPEFFGIDRPGDIVETYYHRGDGYWGAGVNHWEMCFFLGIPVICLSFVGMRKERFWLGIIGVSVLLMLGGRTPAWDILRSLPGLEFFRFPVRFSLCLTLAFAVLSSRGLDELVSMERRRADRWARGFLCLGLGALLVLVGAGYWVESNETRIRGGLQTHFETGIVPLPEVVEADPLMAATLPEPEPEDPETIPLKIDRILASVGESTSLTSGRVLMPFFMVLGVSVLLIRRDRWGNRRMAFGVISLAYLDLWSFGSGYIERVDPEEAGLRTETASRLGESIGEWRSTVVDRRQNAELDGELMSASLGLLYGTQDVIITSPLMISRNEAYLATIGLDVGDKGTVKLERLGAHPEWVDLLGLRWLFSVHDLSEMGYPRINDSAEEVGIYENLDPLPLGFLVGCASRVDDPLAAMMTTDPRQTAIVEASTGVPDCDDGARAGSVRSAEVSPTELRFESRSEVPTILVDARTWYPGWEARVDGVSVPIIRANLAFRGIELDPGQHGIVLKYEPTWAQRAYGFVGFGLLGVVVWIGIRRRHESVD